MDKVTYDNIVDFCSRHKYVLNTVESNYILQRFLVSYYDSLGVFEERNGRPATPQEEVVIVNSLMNQSTLNSYADSARQFYVEIANNEINHYKKSQSAPSFFKDVGTNMLANLLYSLFLILMFIIGKDYVVGLLKQLTSTKP